MAKSFNILKDKLTVESKQRIEKRVAVALQEMPLAELRQARKLTQQQIAKTLKIKQASAIFKGNHVIGFNVKIIAQAVLKR